MTHESAPSPDSAHDLLTSVRDLTRQVRFAQRGTWFPLLVLGVITVAAIPVYEYGSRHLGGCRLNPPAGKVCGVFSPWALVYWPIALVLAYAVIAGFYVHQSRQRGVGTRIAPYAVAGAAIAVLTTAAALWRAYHVPSPAMLGSPFGQIVSNLTTPTAAIGLALLILTWVERNRALAAFSLVYLVLVLLPESLLPADLGGLHHQASPGVFLPRLLIPGAMLLLGSIGFALSRPSVQGHAR